MLKILILICILAIFFYIFCNKKKEDYTTLFNNDFFTYLENNGYKIDKDEKVIYGKDDYYISYHRYFNTYDSARIADDKTLSSSLLSGKNIPVPKFFGLNRNNYNKIEYLFKENNLTFPIVAKRVDGSFGNGIETNIPDMLSLKNISKELLSRYKTIQIEEQGKGNCYRILVFNNQIIDVICREKPYVIGNGKNSILELIEIKNNELTKIKYNFRINNYNDRYLDSQGFKINQIPPNGVKVYITNVINYHNGANSYRIDLNKIPTCNKNLFLDTAKAMNIKCSGIDYLSDDITIPFYENSGKILELNCRPDIDIHLENQPKYNNFYEAILKNLK